MFQPHGKRDPWSLINPMYPCGFCMFMTQLYSYQASSHAWLHGTELAMLMAKLSWLVCTPKRKRASVENVSCVGSGLKGDQRKTPTFGGPLKKTHTHTQMSTQHGRRAGGFFLAQCLRRTLIRDHMKRPYADRLLQHRFVAEPGRGVGSCRVILDPPENLDSLLKPQIEGYTEPPKKIGLKHVCGAKAFARFCCFWPCLPV